MSEDPHVRIGRTLLGDGLEIGPGSYPFPVSDAARVRYVDRPVAGGRDRNWPELAGAPRGPRADLSLDLDADGLAPIADYSVDWVVACHVIEHLANPLRAFEEFHRVLRPGGRLVFVVPDRNATFDAVRQPTPFARLFEKFQRDVTEVADDEIREFCTAIYYQPPIHPPQVREWHNPQALDAGRLALHRRRSIHVHCWSLEEFAALIAAALFVGLGSWRLADLYFPGTCRQIEFGLVLERSESTGVEFVRDWAAAVLNTKGSGTKHIASFACSLHRDLARDHFQEALDALPCH